MSSNGSRSETRKSPRRLKTPEKEPSSKGSRKSSPLVSRDPRTRSRSNPRSPPSRAETNHSSQSTTKQLSQSTLRSSRRSANEEGNALFLSDPIDLSSPLHYNSDVNQSLKSPTGSQKSTASTFKKRADITTDTRFVRQINIAEGGIGDGSTGVEKRPGRSNESHASATPHLVIWGTDVAINQCKEKFKSFVKYPDFDLSELAHDEIEQRGGEPEIDVLDQDKRKLPFYIRKLEEIYALEEPFLNVNCQHINQFDPELYRQLVSYPQEVIATFDMAVNEVFFERYPDAQLPHQINVRPYNVIRTSCLRSLNPEDINQLVTIAGMVIRCSNIIPEMREGFFECSVCKWTTTVEVDRGRIAEPTLCRHCNTNHAFRLVHNRSQFIDKQQIKLQESPDDMPAGQTPYTVLLYACADLVDAVQPGDRVTITGIYRATPVRVNPRQRNVKSIYRTHVDVVHYRKVDAKRLHDESKEFHFTKDRIDKLKGLSRLPDIYERLAHALAPSIYEHEDIKKGILLQLFGGTRKDTSYNPKRRYFRSEINILLCGDPGTSKSQLLQYVYHLVPRGQYTSGKGSSAVGLTAYITKDPDTRQLVLQTGALVLSDGGICCIDEFDKMSDSTRSILHEVMEQQTLSIAKAGIVCQLNARTSVLAAANPVESQWNKNKTIIENIQLPHTLLSRFDLIFLLLDPQDETYDRRLARHLVSLYYRTHEEEQEELLDINLLKDYIAYARNYILPHLTEESSQTLIHAYVEMRKVGSGKGQITAYPRQLESLIRLAEAHAKVRLSSTVTNEDVEEAIRLHREAIKQSATDPASGKIDISILTTGMSSSSRKRRNEVAQALKRLLQTMKMEKSSQEYQQFPVTLVYNEIKAGSTLMITRDMYEDALKDLQDEGFLVLVAGKHIRLCN